MALDEFEPGISVSTLFLGLDHRFYGDGPPLVFETMVFGYNEANEAFVSRYSSWEDAELGHKATVRKVKALVAKALQGVKITT